jgi:F-box-like
MADDELEEDYTENDLVHMSSDTSTDINSLPNEILEYILSLLSPYCDLKSTLQVCKRWYIVTKGI